MRSGAMRQRVQLQAPNTMPDGMGGIATTGFVTVATIWAQIDPVGGAERLQAEQMTPIITHDIAIRYRTGVVPKMRLVRLVGGQTYEIHAVANFEMRNRFLNLQCSEIQVAGA